MTPPKGRKPETRYVGTHELPVGAAEWRLKIQAREVAFGHGLKGDRGRPKDTDLLHIHLKEVTKDPRGSSDPKTKDVLFSFCCWSARRRG